MVSLHWNALRIQSFYTQMCVCVCMCTNVRREGLPWGFQFNCSQLQCTRIFSIHRLIKVIQYFISVIWILFISIFPFIYRSNFLCFHFFHRSAFCSIQYHFLCALWNALVFFGMKIFWFLSGWVSRMVIFFSGF